MFTFMKKTGNTQAPQLPRQQQEKLIEVRYMFADHFEVWVSETAFDEYAADLPFAGGGFIETYTTETEALSAAIRLCCAHAEQTMGGQQHRDRLIDLGLEYFERLRRIVRRREGN